MEFEILDHPQHRVPRIPALSRRAVCILRSGPGLDDIRFIRHWRTRGDGVHGRSKWDSGKSESLDGILGEDVNEVIEVVHNAGLARKAARLPRLSVIKG
jgi:hypothetical protein